MGRPFVPREAWCKGCEKESQIRSSVELGPSTPRGGKRIEGGGDSFGYIPPAGLKRNKKCLETRKKRFGGQGGGSVFSSKALRSRRRVVRKKGKGGGGPTERVQPQAVPGKETFGKMLGDLEEGNGLRRGSRELIHRSYFAKDRNCWQSNPKRKTGGRVVTHFKN